MVTLPTSTQKPTPPKYGMFLYLGCTASPFASVLWHVTQAVKVCDRSNSDQLCDVKMSNDYTYDELGLKSVEWLGSDRFRQMTDQNEIIVKLDDDTIISKDIMDGLVESFSKSKCKFAGIMRRRQEDGLYWSSGPLMLVKTNHLRQQLQNNFDRLRYNTKHEDVGFSDMLSIRNPEDVCNVDLSLFRHRYYEDSRMTIRYKPYVKCK
ncbi:hypothetical protein BGW41_007486 [Actinomortierella wolfii]|nr:hypothetical protein BGW41_007486 [Actinomortierella wolfii]